ncbi:MAG TPA: hypothetical protein VGQ83_39710 [Polyangia bacterium]|jgi:hypothetical protein
MWRDDEDLDRELGALPRGDLDPLRAERLRRAAQRVLAEERRLAGRPARRAAVRLWGRVLEPALVAGATGVYLVWAVQKVLSLYQ